VSSSALAMMRRLVDGGAVCAQKGFTTGLRAMKTINAQYSNAPVASW
jgi:hypothetical protein